MLSFSNPVVGGTTLQRPAIQSPGYQSGVTGWIVNADGSAEFMGASISGKVTAATFEGTNFLIDSNGIFFYG